MVEDLDFEELKGATLTEKRRAVDLAKRRYSWSKDRDFIKRSLAVFVPGILVASAILFVLPASEWLFTIVLIMTAITSRILVPLESERIRPLLGQSLKDVRRHPYM